MNINRENKIIWWAPERCATKLTAEIFKKLGFEVFDKEKQDFVSLSEHYHSHDIVFPEEFKDYKLICNIRNPYDRVLSFYLNFTSVGKNYVYTKHKKDDFKKRMDVFTLELFEYAIFQNKLINKESKTPVKYYVTKLNFDGKIPDYFIKSENILDDLSRLDFVTQSNQWNSGEIQEIVNNNKFHNKRPFSFSEVYNPEGANRIFNFFKKHFFICDYDPFSFTNQELSNDDKIKFIHEIF